MMQKKRILTGLLAGAVAFSTAFGAIPAGQTAGGSETVLAAETNTAEYKYVTMNVPYTDFYKAYNLTDKAVWEVETGVDAVSTATTSKFKGSTGLAKGTYNNGKYIMGVTLPVAVKAEDYSKLETNLTENDAYFFKALDAAPAASSKLTVGEDRAYSFSKLTEADIKTDALSVKSLTYTNKYGDYLVTLDGLTSTDYTYYGVILNMKDGSSYGLSMLENIWLPKMQLAWSVKNGSGKVRKDNKTPYYQFDTNGGTLTGVTVLTDQGSFEISTGTDGLELKEYYTGNLDGLTCGLTDGSKELSISGIPEALKNVKVTVALDKSDNLVTEAAVTNGKVVLDAAPAAGKNYDIQILNDDYAPIQRKASIAITEAQKAKLTALINAAKALVSYDTLTELKAYVEQAQIMTQSTTESSVNAESLITNLTKEYKKYCPVAEAAATLKGKVLSVTSDKFSEIKNPTYELSSGEGKKKVTLAGGELSAATVTITGDPVVGTEYTLTIVSDNYQDITVKVTAEAAEQTANQTGGSQNPTGDSKNQTGDGQTTTTGSSVSKGATTVTLKAVSTPYTGKAINVGDVVEKAKAISRKGSNGEVTYTCYSDKACKKAVTTVKNAGTYYVKATVAADDNYSAATSSAVKFTVGKAAQKLTVTPASKSYKVSKLKKKAASFTIKANKNQGKVTYKSSSKKVTVTSKGKVTVKKGTKKGTYKITVTAAKTANYKSVKKTITIKVK